jgi:ferredoxin-NADP reductase
MARPPQFTFQAGQRLRIHHQGVQRDYSLASAPADPDLTILVQPFDAGAMTPWLCRLAEGERLTISGAYGHFLFQPSGLPPVFVATGTGVAPFRAMAAGGVSGFLMLHGMRRPTDQMYGDILSDAARKYIPCVSGSPDAGIDGFNGRVTAYLSAHMPDYPCDFYLCGRQNMIRDMIRIIDRGCPGSRIYTEAFY